jgi:protein-L-isoaspartate(D-aspartate) O-methyltransferase
MNTDFATARKRMVENQIRTVDVTDLRVLDAFMATPREQFLAGSDPALAYVDRDLEIARGRYLVPGAQLARLVQAAQIGNDDVVLDIGCASGYSACVLGRLAGSVIALEEDGELAENAEAAILATETENVAIVRGPLAAGWAAEAPYDLVFIGGSIEIIPDAIGDQIREGGRLIAVQGQGGAAVARLWLKQDGSLVARRLFNCALPAMPGFARKAEFVF